METLLEDMLPLTTDRIGSEPVTLRVVSNVKVEEGSFVRADLVESAP